jgi:hypothetical protein
VQEQSTAALFAKAQETIKARGHQPECRVTRISLQVENPSGHPFFVVFETDDASTPALACYAPNSAGGTIRDKVLSALRAATKPIRGALIAHRIGHAYDANLRRILWAMCKAGEIVRLVEGYSVLTTPIPTNTDVPSPDGARAGRG